MSRLITVLGVVCLALGLALVLRPATAAPRAPVSVPTVAAPTTSSPRPSAEPPIPDGYRIQIPRLGIDLPIVEGDVERDTVQQQTPENYAFHLPGTRIPGAGGNSYIYAHARRGMFLTLWNAAIGDEVWISTPDGRALRYLVSEIHPKVSPDDVSWATPSGPDRLTLQTSTGPDPGDPRFVVIALPG